MMQAEEFISRYSAMEYDVRVAREFHANNQEKIAQYDTIGDVKDEAERQRDIARNELASANEAIDDLNQRLVDEIKALKKSHWEEIDES